MTVATVRLLAADPETHDRATAVGDGTTLEYRLPNYPVVANSQTVYVAGVAKTEGADYTLADETGVLTFGAAPANLAAIAIPYRHTLLSDASLQQLLTLEGNNDKLAAAAALDVIASSEALIQKKIELLDLKTDGPAVAKSLREHAKSLRDQVAAGVGEDPSAAFDWAELVVDDFSARERVYSQAVRSW